jgi:hypothetical protein
MSNRTLVELNHDLWGKMNSAEFLAALQAYLGSASPENADRLSRYGVRIFGMRHHSEGFDIKWGWHEAKEE